MSEADKVNKGTFVILLEYLNGLQGHGNKQRVVEDASRRALRYMKYSEQKEGDNEQIADKNTNKTKSIRHLPTLSFAFTGLSL